MLDACLRNTKKRKIFHSITTYLVEALQQSRYVMWSSSSSTLGVHTAKHQ